MAEKGVALTVQNLAVGYPNRKVIDNLSLAPMVGGEVVALVGPNAAGKTTLLRGLAGLTRGSGSVRLGSRELFGLSAAEYASYVTYMPQSLPQRVALSVFEAVLSALKASPHSANAGQDDHGHALRTLQRLGIEKLALRALDELSGGQRQMASLAQALAREPSVLLLDEPTSALDLHHQMRVMSVVKEIARERNIVVLVVLHDIALACRWCERVIVLSQGKVVADGAPEIAVSPSMFADVYGVSARVERCSRGFMQIMVDGVLDATLAQTIPVEPG
ncbi:ABC transporter ATP-binding protein [Pseudaminobacter sp. NGMCC 1.201702]|uniref:ABC transporter ATP-binding protein n=1 Tax=Pseudaminobacter sp. NGMCC 1.201702 TaxID=3391825 RepID=UPI0039F0D0A2